MLMFIILVLIFIFIIKTAPQSEEQSKNYSSTPSDAKKTYNEWDHLYHFDEELKYSRDEWSEIDKEDFITKDEYERDSAAWSC